MTGVRFFYCPVMHTWPTEVYRMHPHLEKLMELQVIDYDLGELERSKDYLPDMMDNLRDEIKEAEQKLTDVGGRLEEAKIKQKQLELEIKTKEAELQKYQQQMMSIKTNKEYDALVAEIDNLKETVSSRETELLETIEVSTTLESGIEQLRETEKQVKENNEKQLKILKQKIDSIGSKVTNKEDARKEIISEIPRPTWSTYERVRKGRGGRAVVVVKKRACSSCYKALTPKKIQEIKRANQICTCDNCGSLLYWVDAESN